MAHDVFISYASADKLTADAACAVLEQHGVRAWIAPRDVLPGADWAASIVEAIEQSRVMVLVFSSHANKSPQICREVERAVNKGIPVLPLRIEDALPSKSLEYFISARHWLDAMTPPLERHLERLAKTIRRLMGDLGDTPLGREPDDQLWADQVARRLAKRRPWGVVAGLLLAAVAALAYWGGVWPRQGGVAATQADAAEQHLTRSQAQLHAGDFVAAIESTTKAIESAPQSASAYSLRALAEAMSNRLDAAEADANRALMLDDDLAAAYAARALTWAEKNDLRLAAKDAADAVQRDGQSGWARIAQSYVHMLNYEEPAALAELALAMKTPQRGLALAYRGYARLAGADFDKAAEDATESLAISPKCNLALSVRSMAYSRMGKHEKSLTDADEALRLDSTDAFAYAVRAMAFLGADKPLDALADAKEAVRRAEAMKLNPHMEADIYATAGWACAENGQWDVALKYADQAVAKNPRFDYAYMVRGLVKLKWIDQHSQGDASAAEQDLLTATELAPRNPYNWYWLAWTRLELDEEEANTEGALAAIERAIALGGADDLSCQIARAACLVHLERWDEALEAANAAESEADRQEGGRAYFHFWRGRALMGLKQYAQAEKDFAEAARLDPKDAYSWNWLAQSRHWQGDKNELALEAVEQVIKLGGAEGLSPYTDKMGYLCGLDRWDDMLAVAKLAEEEANRDDSTREYFHYWMGRALTGKGQYAEAEEQYRKALTLGPEDPYSWYWLAQSQMGQNSTAKYEEALASLDRAVEGEADDITPLTAKVICLGLLERWDDALSMAEAANAEIDRTADTPAILAYWRGRALAAKKRWKEAEVDLKRAAELNGHDMHAPYWLGVAQIKQGKFKDAIGPLERSIELGIPFTDAYASYARSLVEAGSPAEAVAAADEGFKKLTASNQDLSNVHFWRGVANAALQNYAEAEKDFSHALEGDPEATYKLYWRGCMRALLGQFAPALEDFERIAKPEEMTDVDLDVFTISARCYVELGQWAKALEAADKAVELNGRLKRSAEKALFWRGRARMGQNDFAAAADDFRAATKLAPKNARSRYWLGRALAGGGKYGEAVEELKAVRDMAGAQEFADLDELVKEYEAAAAKAR